MTALAILAVTSTLLAPAQAPATGDPVRAAIASAVRERIGDLRSVDVQIVSAPGGVTGAVSASPTPGARLGKPVRFLITPASGQPFTVVARVSVVAAHASPIHRVDRGDVLTSADVEWKEGRIDGQLIQPLPALEDVVGSRARRAIATGEVFTAAVLAPPVAVKAGEEVALTIRSGAMQARGRARAVNSGSVGDVIRVTTPGSREIRRARIIAPASVEIVR